nr:ribonuclease domain-containing protein [Bacillus paramycoides]
MNYLSGYRGNDRILYSNDGLVYKTSDHYKTFTELTLPPLKGPAD